MFWIKITAVCFMLTYEVRTIELPKLPIPSVGKLLNKDSTSSTQAAVTAKSAPAQKNAKNVQSTISNATSQIGSEIEDIVDCYKELGCFKNGPPWFTPLRPFPKPMKPTEIDTKIYLYTSNKPTERYNVTLWDNISIEGSDFDPNRDYTAFITHGFASNGNNTWVSDLKDAYLKKRNANVFIVDWGKGASTWNYLQVGANTRIVGAELARFGKFLVEQKRLNPSKIHLMGHSLGAHISALMAKTLNKVGRLSAFDPAQPGFEGCADEVRLTKNDADFVDVLHTNSRPIIPLLGFGLILPTGHVDYYFNGGLIQPGCKLPPVDQVKLESISGLAKYPVEVISEWVSCSHGKSYQYFTEALVNDFCTMWGKSAGIISTAFDIGTLGVSEKLLAKFTSCNLEKCSPIGLETDEYPARGIFIASTHSGSPYCFDDPKISKDMREQRARQLEQSKSGGVTEKSSIKKTVSKVAGVII